jgi:hypothetical protein
MKNAIIILSHCDTEKKLQVLQDNISKLKKHPNLDIILTSHISLPQEIIDSVNYFVYDKSNPILEWPQRGYHFYQTYQINDLELILNCISSDYGWTVFNQILLGGKFINSSHDYVYILNYDLDIDTNVDNIIKSNNNKSYLAKNQNWKKTIYFPSLIFSKLTFSQFQYLIENISVQDYISSPSAETYFGEILKSIDYEVPDFFVKDQIDFFDKKVWDRFNNSPSPEFKCFMSNCDKLQNWKLPLFYNSSFIYDIKQDIDLIVNDQKLKISPGNNYLFETLNIKFNNTTLLPMALEKDNIRRFITYRNKN